MQTSSEQQSGPIEQRLGDWGLWARIAVVIWPLLAALGAYWYCESREPNCRELNQPAHETKPQTDKSDSGSQPFAVSYKSYRQTAEQKAIEGNAPLKCSIPCHIVKKALDDAVAFFTAFLVYVVYIQVLLMLGQEKWLRRSWKVGAFSNRLTINSIKTAQDTAKRQLRAYLGVRDGHIEMIAPLQGTPRSRYKVFVNVANFGQTPAKNVRKAVDAKLLNPDHSVFESEGGKGNWVIAPNVPYWTLVKEVDLDGHEVAAINDKKMALFLWGKARYEDIFGRTHELGFRYRSGDKRLPNGWHLDPEPEGNYSKDDA